MQPAADLAVLLPRDPIVPQAPVLTYLDEASGERVALTAEELGGWAARTAALLEHGCGLGRGARAAVLLPPHWQTAAVLLGTWSAGVAVEFRPWATAGLPDSGGEGMRDAVFVSRARADSWLEAVPAARHRFVLALAPGDTPPAGYRDYLAEVERYPATAPAYGGLRPDDAATPDGTSYREWAGVAQGIAERLGLRAGDRLLVDVAQHEQPVAWLLAPLLAGASVVLCANSDPATRNALLAREHITHVL
jgi:uncharacterized protein (TIGR03089 family)